jgi:hypothetical protein
MTNPPHLAAQRGEKWDGTEAIPPPMDNSLSLLLSRTVNGELRTPNGERRTVNGERRTVNGERRTPNGERNFGG